MSVSAGRRGAGLLHDRCDLPHRGVWRRPRRERVRVGIRRMTLDLRRLVDRAGRWLLNYRPQPLAVGAEINRFAKKVAALTPRMSEWLRGDDKAIVAKEAAEFGSRRVSNDLAYMVATALPVQPARRHRHRRHRRSRPGGSRRHLLRPDGPPRHRRSAHRGVPAGPRRPLAFVGALGDSRRHYGSLRALCFDVLAVGEPDESGEEKIAEWEMTNSSRVARARRTLNEI